MKFNYRFLQTAFALSFLTMPALMFAQSFTNLYSFTSPFINPDGGVPLSGVMIVSNTLFGTTLYGGSSGYGTVFSINADGTGFTSLYSFDGGSDGKWPGAGLALSANTLYGATSGGGNGGGTIYSIITDGSAFAPLYQFSPASMNAIGANTNADGLSPNCLAVSGNQLYGTSSDGGPYVNGTVFVLNTDGTSFRMLHAFTYGAGYGRFFRNADGSNPGFVLVSGDTLYGTTASGGSSGYGTVFKLKTDGTGFTVLHNFTLPKGTAGSNGTNSDGVDPRTLVLSGTTLYGTTEFGGRSGTGTLFKMNLDGTGFTTIYDGELLFENTSFALSGDTLYWWSGDLCSIKTNGTSLTMLHAGGYFRASGLTLSGDNLFGTTTYGGDFGNGSVFSFLIPPQLSLTISGGTLTLTWPTNAIGFVLQSAKTLSSGGDWQDSTLIPNQANGQNVARISALSAASFFRLRQQ